MKLTIADLQKIPHKEIRYGTGLKGRSFSGVCADSRTTEHGNLFIALRGERFDGHAFVAAAFEKGAAAAIVDDRFESGPFDGRPLVIVEDTAEAFGTLARIYRDKFTIPIIAVGGSNGKTTTKDMIARVLGMRFATLSTEGNHNNHLGVPQTIFRLTPRHEIAVVEVGTNHPGEIMRLCGMLAPTHALLTNIGREHLEFFGTVDVVALEEGVLFEQVRRAKRGTVLLNLDDPRLAKKRGTRGATITYGFTSRSAAVRGRKIAVNADGGASFEFTTPATKRWFAVKLGVPGAHNAKNALAAAAAGYAFHVPALKIREGLDSFRAASKRMETLMVGGVVVFNDTYNANPDSMIAALRTLAATRGSGKKIAVLADMKELGAAAAEEHEAVGRECAALGIDHLLTYGTLARDIHAAAGFPGAIHYDQKNVLAEYLAELAGPGDVVLVKGSRGMKMEDVVTFLQQRLGRPAAT
jgi:UDP-N-acetylmuramoyl-tripeptide--D-alanyl-D-alanine ligase